MIRQAVLLLGGRGTRLWPLTEARPKGLLPVSGLPFFEYQVRMLAELGVHEVFLAVSKAWQDTWDEYLGSRPELSHVETIPEETPLDTAGPVRSMLDRLDGPFLTLNGDVLFDADLRSLLEPGATRSTIVLTRVEDPSSFGVVVLDDSGLVQRFVEKPPRQRAPADTISAVIYLLDPEALSQFAEGPLSFERKVFPALAAQGLLAGVVVEGAWMDIGTPELYIEAHEHVSAGLSRVYAPESPHGPGEAGGAIEGFAWIGKGALVEPGASVGRSVLLSGSVVRSGAVVRGSVLAWGAEVLEGAEVTGGTVIGESAVVGAGCELSGVRIAPGVVLPERAVTMKPPR
ncbi:MAG TPA: NDP-sugar synthase [Acidimicrobiia bacterium]